MTLSVKSANRQRSLLKSAALIALVLSQQAFAQALPPVAANAPTTAPVKALSNDIDPFHGDIDPFHGDIDPFHGDIDPFSGDIDPFTGDITLFHGDINPFHGDINPFSGDINPFWGTSDPAKRPANPNTPAWAGVGSYWNGAAKGWKGISDQAATLNSADPLANQKLADSLTAFVAQADATWGKAFSAANGKTFQTGFVDPLFAKYGVSAANPATLAKLSTAQRNRLFLEWYDGLMAYSGVDRVDWWMSAVGWSPAITQQQGKGADTVIGLLDADARSSADIALNIAWAGGSTTSVNGHGAGVASLLVAAHDGKGVMGIAPKARVVAYDPFDATNSASWADIQTGVNDLRARGASIINASLGVPGWTMPQEWQGIMATVQARESIPALDPTQGMVAASSTRNTTPVYVIAAGNSGTAQTQNLNWDFATDPAFLVVGSVGPTGKISSFSNQPGTACLLKGGQCVDGNRLMNHFIVAPGEFILVADGNNGVTRASGTSFAAPLVSGAIALLHDRWPWLARYPQETVKIITDTARDLGAPGVDPVYGVGMLDIQHSQSPINFNNLTFFQVKNGVTTQVTAPQLQAAGTQASWDADGVYFTLFERVGNTYRDFEVPMSSRLTGWVRTWTGSRERFQSFITGQFADWINGKSGFSDVNTFGFTMPNGIGLRIAGSTPVATGEGHSFVPHSALTVELPGSHIALTAGHGYGALVNGAQPGFARSVDYDVSGGGANPLLGLASGGAFAQAQARMGGGTVSMGFTQNRVDYRNSNLFSDLERMSLRDLAPYRANAVNIHVTQPLGNRLTVAVDYARVHEANALLGVQSSLSTDFLGGSTTDAYSLGMQLDLGSGVALAATGTQGRTRSDGGQALVTEGAVGSSAYSLAIRKQGLAAQGDLLSLTFSQPLHVHKSTLSLTEMQIADRLTGELGSGTRTFGIGGQRVPVAAELQYGAPFAEGKGRIGLYGKGDIQAAQGNSRAFVVGGHMNLAF